MPLVPVDYPAQEQLEGVRFAMKDGEATVGVLVTHEALQDIESPPPGEGEYILRFEMHRSTFERLASAKHAAGQMPVIIHSSDVT